MKDLNHQVIHYKKNYPLKKILELETFNDLRPSRDRMAYIIEEEYMDLNPFFVIVSSDENPETRLIGGIVEQAIFLDTDIHNIFPPQYASGVVHEHFETEADALSYRKSLIKNSFLNDEELLHVYGVKRVEEEDSLIAA